MANKRKTGPRYRNGRRKWQPSYDKGTDAMQAKQRRFGAYGTTGLGRAYSIGLLGNGDEAKARIDAGEQFARLRRAYMPHSKLTANLSDTPRGEPEPHDESDQRRHARLIRMAKAMDATGGRPYLDSMLQEGDSGPPWLDRLIDGGKNEFDQANLKAALKALDAIAPKVRHRIRVAVD